MNSTRLHFILLLLLVGTLFAASEGCVRRRIAVRSDPPGAVAYLDNVELGKTPISRNFDFYGKRELRLVKDGYETHTELVALPAPWYEWPGIDFVSEILIPGEIKNQHFFDVRLRPQQMVPPDDLIMQAEQLRATAHASGAFRVGNPTEAFPSTETQPFSSPTNPYIPPIPQGTVTPSPQYFPEPPPTQVTPFNSYPQNPQSPQNQPDLHIQPFQSQPPQQFPEQRLQITTPPIPPNTQNP